MGLVKKDDGWRMPDELWAKLELLLPARPAHPLGCHNPRVPDRQAMDAILLVLRTGMQWGALQATGLCHPSSAYRRFREWLAAGVFREFWRLGLLAYDGLAGINWSWLALDGAMGKAPLGGGKNRPQPHGQGEDGHQEKPADGLAGRPPSASWPVAPTRTTSNWHAPRSSPFQFPGPRPLKRHGSTSGWTEAMTTMRCDGWPRSSASRYTCLDVVTGRARRRATLVRRHGGGWSSAGTPGSTASVACWCAGRSARTLTSGCCTLPWASSLGSTRSYRNKL